MFKGIIKKHEMIVLVAQQMRVPVFVVTQYSNEGIKVVSLFCMN